MTAYREKEGEILVLLIKYTVGSNLVWECRRANSFNVYRLYACEINNITMELVKGKTNEITLNVFDKGNTCIYEFVDSPYLHDLFCVVQYEIFNLDKFYEELEQIENLGKDK